MRNPQIGRLLDARKVRVFGDENAGMHLAVSGAPRVRVGTLVGLATLMAGRRLLGGDRPALDAALTRACQAMKDRTGDHLASVLNREPVDAAYTAALRSASRDALAANIASTQLPWVRRVRAAAPLGGRDGDGSSTGRISGALDVFSDLGVPGVLIAACSAYASRARDLLPVLVPMAWLLFASGCKKEGRGNSAYSPRTRDDRGMAGIYARSTSHPHRSARG